MKSQKGFSLIELLVVATIIIVLSTIGVVSFSSSGKTARDNRRKADIEMVRQALVLHRNEQGGYPTISANNPKDRYGGMVDMLADGGYLSDPTPLDPKNDDIYYYGYTSTYQNPTFCLCAELETDKGNKTSRSCEGSYLTSGQFYCVQQP